LKVLIYFDVHPQGMILYFRLKLNEIGRLGRGMKMKNKTTFIGLRVGTNRWLPNKFSYESFSYDIRHLKVMGTQTYLLSSPH
jgi:hypothetical protein